MLWLVISYLKTFLYPGIFLLRYFSWFNPLTFKPKYKEKWIGFLHICWCLVLAHSLLKLHSIISYFSPYSTHGCSNLGLCFGFHTWDPFYKWKPMNIDWFFYFFFVIDKTTEVHHWLDWNRDVNRFVIMDVNRFVIMCLVNYNEKDVTWMDWRASCWIGCSKGCWVPPWISPLEFYTQGPKAFKHSS